MRSTDRPNRLPSGDDVHHAALWRLAGWPIERVESHTAKLSRLLEEGRGPDEAVDVLTQAIDAEPQGCPKERRSAWTAACAVAALLADARGDVALYWRAGSELLGAMRQAQRRQGASTPPDALDELLGEYLRRHPGTAAGVLWDHCATLAGLRATIILDAAGEVLTYATGEDEDAPIRDVGRHAFEQRVTRARQRIASANPVYAATGSGTTSAPLRRRSR